MLLRRVSRHRGGSVLPFRCISSAVSTLDTLRARGLVKTTTADDELARALDTSSIAFYCGVDPTAASLHLGNLLTLMPSLHLVLRGHKAFALVGGGTGRIGDPAGKTQERDRIQAQRLRHNVSKLEGQLFQFFSRGIEHALRHGWNNAAIGTWRVVNNADWYDNLRFMDFMDEVGRNVRMSKMLARDSVKSRLASDAGMSFGEFVYQLLQAYDFLHLNRHHGVRLQLGGSDQYGNITAGVELVGRIRQQEQDGTTDSAKQSQVFGWTVPLLTTPSGEKFGKSAGNAIWLDPEMTSPFDLYQFMIGTSDEQLVPLLRLFTFLPAERIEELAQMRSADRQSRTVHHTLAYEVIALIHGREVASQTSAAARLLFPKDFGESDRLTADAPSLLAAFANDKRLTTMPKFDLLGRSLTSLLRDLGAVSSGKEARRLILNGGVSVGEHAIRDAEATVRSDWLLDETLLVIRLGKNKFSLVHAT
ncbi:tyrosyl-tRNA synthetase [Savitreella phatthalungensis]